MRIYPLKIDPALMARLVHDNTAEDYISFSIDAGDSQTYNCVHGVPQSEALLYETVKRNVARLVAARKASGAPLGIRATYLITGQNSSVDQTARFIDDFTAVGVDSLRFSAAIVPTMAQRDDSGRFPEAEPDELAKIEQLLAARKLDNGRIVYQKFDTNTRRTLPCFTRWLMPAIGYDGYLYPCCIVATTEFTALRIGDLKVQDFWTAYYTDRNLPFEAANCQCDRKAMEINGNLSKIVSFRRQRGAVIPNCEVISEPGAASKIEEWFSTGAADSMPSLF